MATKRLSIFEEKLLQQEAKNKAAFIITSAIRYYINRRKYLKVRDIALRSETVDPIVILRSINPIEAKLFDSAAGLCIKFRLGGLEFPPKIFYKIFTRRPVVDMGTFSPRDYANERRAGPADLFNKPVATKAANAMPRDDSYAGWYRRVEQNGWRLMTSTSACFPEEVARRPKRPAVWQPKVVRAQEAQRIRRQIKIEWMKKMYNTAARGEASAEPREITTEDDSELQDEELLAWCDGLDYDQYVSDWTTMATTVSSDAY